MKMSKVFHDALWDYSSHVVSVVGRQRREREDWMGSREDDFRKCDEAFAKLEQLWTYDRDDLEVLKSLHRKFLDLYQQGRPDEAQKLLKRIDELVDNLRDKWKNA